MKITKGTLKTLSSGLIVFYGDYGRNIKAGEGLGQPGQGVLMENFHSRKYKVKISFLLLLAAFLSRPYLYFPRNYNADPSSNPAIWV